jgi:16S rRNA (uracil1498-N3)-methyltransferase
MPIPRIYIDLPLIGGRELTLPYRASQHLVQVLRLRRGNSLVLFNGQGRDCAATLVAPSKTAARVMVQTAGDPEPQPTLAVHLGIGISKGERMDFVLQKSVELGVNRITPLFTRRSIVRLEGERLARRMEHWRGVVQAACEQSGRRRLPELAAASALSSWLRLPHSSALLLDHRVRTSLLDLPPPRGEISLLVGPEGGLDDGERADANKADFVGVRLGPRILRTETAPLAALAAMQVLWGDFRH